MDADADPDPDPHIARVHSNVRVIRLKRKVAASVVAINSRSVVDPHHLDEGPDADPDSVFIFWIRRFLSPLDPDPDPDPDPLVRGTGPDQAPSLFS